MPVAGITELLWLGSGFYSHSFDFFKMVGKVCLFCSSSPKIETKYFEDAGTLAEIFASQHVGLKYGGGASGLMGKVADVYLERKGKITGIIPQFMLEMGWNHPEVKDMLVVKTMHERKQKMMEGVDAVVALPGGCGTLEELSEAISLKQLGQFTKPIIILNTNHFYDSLLVMFRQMIDHHFMRNEHQHIWTSVTEPSQVLPAIENAPQWDPSLIKIAAV